VDHVAAAGAAAREAVRQLVRIPDMRNVVSLIVGGVLMLSGACLVEVADEDEAAALGEIEQGLIDVEINCTDHVDNDGDGAIDLADTDCKKEGGCTECVNWDPKP
jgi:hypothetical protein